MAIVTWDFREVDMAKHPATESHRVAAAKHTDAAKAHEEAAKAHEAGQHEQGQERAESAGVHSKQADEASETARNQSSQGS